MPMITTDAGIAAGLAADKGGFLISLNQFSVTEATGFQLAATDKALVGAEVFRADISTIEAIDQNTIRLTCTIPAGKPVTGQWNIGEIGIWSSTGELFAHGSFTVFPKSSEYGLKFYVYVTMARLGVLINITTSDVFSLPSAARVASLLPPTDSTQNAVVVFDANPHQEEISHGAPTNASSPALAVKYGPGGSYWGFAGHNRVYIGNPDSVISASSFNLDPGINGFWIADGEVAIIQVLSGAGEGQSRKMQYNANAKRFVSIDDPFDALNTLSKLGIWRSHANMLPTRKSGVPDYMVLGIGENSFRYTTISTTASKLVPYPYTAVGNGTEIYNIPASSLPLANLESAEDLIVSINGIVLDETKYSISGTQLRIMGGVASGTPIVLWGFVRDESEGGEFVFQEAEYDVDGTTSYNMPVIPDNKAYLLVIRDGGQIAAPESYSISGAKLVFAEGKQPTSGKLYILAYGNAVSDEVRGTLVRDRVAVTTAVTEIDTSASITTRKAVMVFVNGQYVSKSLYKSIDDRIVFKSPISNCVVDLLNFRGEDTTTIKTKSGTDTGPQWVDPAGIAGQPNKLIPIRRTYIANEDSGFEVNPVYDIAHLMFFVGDRYLPPTDFIYDGQYVYPKEILSGGQPIEIICFTSIDHPGTSATPQMTRLTANGGKSYTIHTNANAPSLVVTIGGGYIPSTAWTYDPNTGVITFTDNAVSGLEIMAWSYRDVDSVGQQVRMFNTIIPIVSTKVYTMEGLLDETADVLAFKSGTGLSYSRFALSTSNGFSFLNFVSNPDTTELGLDLQAVQFSTRTPEARLVLRTELKNYLKASNNLSDVPDKAAARANLEIGKDIAAALATALLKSQNLADVPDKQLGRNNLGVTDAINGVNNTISQVNANLTASINSLDSQVLKKVFNLADVPDKAAARDNLGITALLNNLANNMLYRSNNLADVPDKAAARANLGIDSNNGVVMDMADVNNWSVKIGPFILKGGTYVVPQPTGGLHEGIGPVINFRTAFPNTCLNVVLGDIGTIDVHTFDYNDFTQVAYGSKTQVGFTCVRQQSYGKTDFWFGVHWLALGF